MATGGSDLTSDEILGIKCCICAEENRCGEADKYCVQCKDYYCSTCVGAHSRIPALRGHKLLDKSDFTSLGQDGSLPSFPTQRCPKHQNEVINMYCKDHDEVTCASCIALCHRTCKDIHSIAEEIDILYNSADVDPVEKKMIALKSKIEELMKSKEENIKTLERSLKEAMDKVKVFRREIETLMDEIEAETLREIRACFSRIQNSLDDDKLEVKAIIDSLNEAVLQLNKAQGNMAQEFVSLKNCEKLAIKAEAVDEAQRKPRDTTFCFNPDQQVKQLFDRTQTFGKVVCLRKVKEQKYVNVKLSDDTRDCCIWGSCITEDGYLLMADSDNKRIKRLLLSDEQVKDYIDFTNEPLAVCQINNTEAAVAQLNKTVQFISLADKMEIIRTLTLNHYCHGIAHADGKLFITDENKAVYIYDFNGHELRKITTDSAGVDIFLMAKHIFISASGDQVYVADLKNGLVSLDTEGNYLFTINDELCQGYFDACSDQTNVFVCGSDSKNIIQIGPGNKVLGEIAKVTKPRSVCYDTRGQRLIVSSNVSNTIKIFELE